MNRLSDADVRLAHLVDQALEEQPTPRAPADFAARVLTALERDAARPWWRRSVREWPLPARAAFAAAGCALLVLLLAWPLSGSFLPRTGAGLNATLIQHAPLYHAVANASATLGHTVTALANAIPGPLLRNGLLLGALLYATLFGLLALLLRLPRSLPDHR